MYLSTARRTQHLHIVLIWQRTHPTCCMPRQNMLLPHYTAFLLRHRNERTAQTLLPPGFGQDGSSDNISLLQQTPPALNPAVTLLLNPQFLNKDCTSLLSTTGDLHGTSISTETRNNYSCSS